MFNIQLIQAFYLGSKQILSPSLPLFCCSLMDAKHLDNSIQNVDKKTRAKIKKKIGAFPALEPFSKSTPINNNNNITAGKLSARVIHGSHKIACAKHATSVQHGSFRHHKRGPLIQHWTFSRGAHGNAMQALPWTKTKGCSAVCCLRSSQAWKKASSTVNPLQLLF